MGFVGGFEGFRCGRVVRVVWWMERGEGSVRALGGSGVRRSSEREKMVREMCWRGRNDGFMDEVDVTIRENAKVSQPTSHVLASEQSAVNRWFLRPCGNAQSMLER